MSYYLNSYLSVLKRNFMLVVIALMLLIPTFFIWAGIPFFIVGSALSNLRDNPILIHLCIALSGGLIFSVYLLPINLIVARKIAVIKKLSSINLEAVWITVVVIIYVIVNCANKYAKSSSDTYGSFYS